MSQRDLCLLWTCVGAGSCDHSERDSGNALCYLSLLFLSTHITKAVLSNHNMYVTSHRIATCSFSLQMLDIKIRADVGRRCWTTLDDIHFTVLVVNRTGSKPPSRYRLVELGRVRIPAGAKTFVFVQWLDRQWGPTTSLSNGYCLTDTAARACS